MIQAQKLFYGHYQHLIFLLGTKKRLLYNYHQPQHTYTHFQRSGWPKTSFGWKNLNEMFGQFLAFDS